MDMKIFCICWNFLKLIEEPFYTVVDLWSYLYIYITILFKMIINLKYQGKILLKSFHEGPKKMWVQEEKNAGFHYKHAKM